MKKFLASNVLYGILAVGLAAFLSIYVSSAENPVTNKTFHNVSVAVNGLASDHVLEDRPGTVDIQVSGFRSVVNLTFARDVRAYVDLSTAQLGTASYPIQYIIPKACRWSISSRSTWSLASTSSKRSS